MKHFRTRLAAKTPFSFLCLWIIGGLLNSWVAAQESAGEPSVYQVGVARFDVTPEYPIRLNGFGNRRQESEGVGQRIWAKALAISQGEAPPIVLLSLDSLGVRLPMVDALAAALKQKHGVPRENVVLTFTHSHCTPKVNGASDTIFSTPIPESHQKHIDRYTDELLLNLIKVASEAVTDRQPSKLEWSVGSVDFAVNRRTPGGPVDHSLPVLFVSSLEGDLRAIYTTYACHCVTLSYNKIHGDWAGAAQEAIEREHPGTLAMVSIGCGSDSNPDSGVTGANEAIVIEQGGAIAAEVKRLLSGKKRKIEGRPHAILKRIDLPLQELPTRTQLEKLSQQASPVGYNAKWQLQLLEQNGMLQDHLDYPIQSIQFGSELAMVFLAGEVCVDYAVKLRELLRRDRLWLHGYSNDFCAYIPSERLLREGGYGGGGEVVYFALPAMLQTGVEEKILNSVLEQLPDLKVEPGTRGVPPTEPEASLQKFKISENLEIQLVASEPLIRDPVAIDFGFDGRLWVAEMPDYARSVDAKFEGEGRVKFLLDRDQDGAFDEAQVFVDGLRFPTEVKAWKDGILVCDAPDVLFCRDTNADGVADQRRVLLTGFATHNPHARVNSLRWGLDGWLYGSCGLFGGVITTENGEEVNLTGRDFRWRPDEGRLEPVTGTTQQGRDRDDWNRWYGCDNGTLLKAYTIEDRYLRQSSSVTAPPTQVSPWVEADPQRIFPAGDLVLFKLSGKAGRPTSACGLGIYRDRHLGREYDGNSFTCEPVNQLITRRALSEEAGVVRARRVPGEETTEFLTSTDQWFRPVQMRTGPDGGLWIVDMYRYVIEHPRWIPEETKAKLNVFAGQQRGRIYRIQPKGSVSKPWPKVKAAEPKRLQQWIGSSNGTLRDMVHQYVTWNDLHEVASSGLSWVRDGVPPAVQAQVLALAQQHGALPVEPLMNLLEHPSPQLRRWVLQLLENVDLNEDGVQKMAARMGDDSEAVRRQAIWSLGQQESDAAVQVLLDHWPAIYRQPFGRSATLVGLDRSGVRHRLIDVILENRSQSDRQAWIHPELLKVAFSNLDDDRLMDVATRMLHADQPPHHVLKDPVFHALMNSLLRVPENRVSEEWSTVQGAALGLLVDDDQRDANTVECCLDVLLKTSTQRPQMQDRLLGLVDATQPIDLQKQVASRLAADLASESIWPRLLERLRHGTPDLQATTIDHWLSRLTGRRWLVMQCQQDSTITRWLSVEQRRRWLELSEAEDQASIAMLLRHSGETKRADIVRAYQASFNEVGSVARGQMLFKKHCANCHAFGESQAKFGPDLAALGNKTRMSLLASILDPSRDIDARYRNVLITTTEGLSVGGLLVEENASTIRLQVDPEKQVAILRNEVESLATLSTSFMPEGFEKDLSEEHMQDLVSFLMSNVGSAKEVAGNQPVLVEQGEGGQVNLLAAQASIHGGDITFEQPFQNIGLWHSVEDFVRWDFTLDKATDVQIRVHYACHPSSAGNQMVVAVGEHLAERKVPSTGGWDQYRTLKLGKVSLPAGTHQLSLFAQGAFRGALLDLKSIELMPVTEN